jgi:F-type H+-transporting ATPase subunit epsilon
MQVTVISPAGSVFEGPADSIVAPAYDGEVGILPRHAPFMTLLGKGTLKIREGEQTRAIRVEGGFLQVARDAIRIVAEYAEYVNGEENGT